MRHKRTQEDIVFPRNKPENRPFEPDPEKFHYDNELR